MNVMFGNHFMFPMNSQYCCLSISKKNLEKAKKINKDKSEKEMLTLSFCIIHAFFYSCKYFKLPISLAMPMLICIWRHEPIATVYE